MVHMGIAKDLPARHCVASESDMTPVYLEKSAFSGVAGGPASAGKVKRAFNQWARLKLSPAERPGHLDIRPIKSESFASIGKDYARYVYGYDWPMLSLPHRMREYWPQSDGDPAIHRGR